MVAFVFFLWRDLWFLCFLWYDLRSRLWFFVRRVFFVVFYGMSCGLLNIKSNVSGRRQGHAHLFCDLCGMICGRVCGCFVV